uniref:C2 NT-type domain-containing protein n=1 Tax=Solanum lycopersicum TaxID=4081 RepID=A0A3Q7I5D5_SOLLC
MECVLFAMSKIGGNEKLLDDIEALNKALCSDNKGGRRSLMLGASNRSTSVGKTHQKSKNRDDLSGKENKKSIWSWKGLKSLAVRNKKFNCCFSVQVHSIEGLSTLFDELCLVVHWKRRDGELTTRPVVVSKGVAEFEEQLTHTCSVSGSKNGPNQSAKYEAKHFLLYASIYATPDLDLGKHRVDLTRLLPLALDELEENSSGKWSTSFRLSGKAKGATMNVSFEYHIVGKTFTVFPSSTSLLDVNNLRRNSEKIAKILAQCEQSDELSKTMRRAGSLPARSSASQCSAENIKDLHEVLPVPSSELSVSVNVMYQKLEEEKVEYSVDCKPQIDVCCDDVKTLKPNIALLSEPEKGNIENADDLSEVSIRDQGIEVASEVQEEKEEETTKTGDTPSEENAEPNSSFGMFNEEEPQLALLSKEVDTQNKDLSASTCNFETDKSSKESIMKELESALKRVSDLENEGFDSQDDENEVINHDGGLNIKGNFEELRKGKSLSLDYDAESVASDFLDMLGIEHNQFSLSSESEPDSPRERLLRQFEKDTLADGGSLFNFDEDIDHQDFACDASTGSDWRSIYEDFDYSCNVEMPKIEIEATSNKIGASMLEDLETEALMYEWGLNERAFQRSPPRSSSGFGSPIDIPHEDPSELPPLGEGLGPFIKTKNGGFLRSVNPSLFKNAKSGGSLIMQVSSPVVVPAEMGSGIMDILHHLASIGIEKLSIQANKLMPLEDITGQTMQHIGWETAPSLDGTVRQEFLQHEFEYGKNMAGIQSNKGKLHRPKSSSKLESNSAGLDKDSEYVSLEDLAPLAMDKIEALSIEGLRIQSGMSDEDTPSNVSSKPIGEFSAIEGKKVNFGGAVGLEGTGGLQLLDVKDNDGGGEVDGLMGLSLTLDEWMKLDAGEIDEISERTSKLLAAHHGTCTDLFRGRSKKRGKGKNCGLLGNSFTVALMVQLRDPLRNYEPVGTPMLALVQVERVFVTPKAKIYSTVSQSPQKEAGGVDVKEEQIREDEEIPQYKITGVHVAGLKTEQGKKKLWGSSSQQQSGSRWLLANGMGKKNKHPLMKSKGINKSSIAAASSLATTTVQPGETLWSISSRVHGTGAKWEELAALNPHIRNPNVIFPNEKIRLR